MRLLVGHDEDVGRFVAQGDYPEPPLWKDGFRAFGIIREDGALIAGVVFDDWHPAQRRVELSARALDPRAFGPGILRQLGDYPFRKLDCFRVWARTQPSNLRARKFLKGIGFTEESTQAHWYGMGLHSVTLRVTAPEWQRRWGVQMKEAA